jgi:hypothetical protein
MIRRKLKEKSGSELPERVEQGPDVARRVNERWREPGT